MDEPDGQPACPECGEPMSGETRHCPGCGFDFLESGGFGTDTDGAAVDDPVFDMAELDSQPACPDCGEPISGADGHCQACGLDFLDENGGLSEEAINAMLEDLDASRESLGPRREFHAPRTVRLIIGLAISIPMAPLALFVAESIVTLPLWASMLVFIFGWAVPGYVLSGFRIPGLVVAAGLVVIGVTLAVTPVLIVAGRRFLGTEPGTIGRLGPDLATAQGVFMLVGLVVVALGAVVYRHVIGTRNQWLGQPDEPTE